MPIAHTHVHEFKGRLLQPRIDNEGPVDCCLDTDGTANERVYFTELGAGTFFPVLSTEAEQNRARWREMYHYWHFQSKLNPPVSAWIAQIPVFVPAAV